MDIVCISSINIFEFWITKRNEILLFAFKQYYFFLLKIRKNIIWVELDNIMSMNLF